MKSFKQFVEDWKHGGKNHVVHFAKIGGHDVETHFIRQPSIKNLIRKPDHEVQFAINNKIHKSAFNPVSHADTHRIFRHVLKKAKQFKKHFGGQLIAGVQNSDPQAKQKLKLYGTAARKLSEEYKKYSHDGKGFRNMSPHKHKKGEEWRTPHGGREYRMMLKGVKPAALVYDEELPKYQKHIKSGKFIHVRISDYESVVALKGEHYRAHKLASLVQKASTPEWRGRADAAQIGRLLGYPKDHVKKFIG